MNNKNTKGIILAGGNGTRLFPATKTYSKQLQLVYDKPMIYYPLCTLMLGDIKDILIISSPRDIPYIRELLQDGSQWGINITYAIQDAPNGIGQSFIIGEEFIGNNQVVLILGDNLFYGYYDFLRDGIKNNNGATAFGYHVSNPQEYGVVEFDENGQVTNLIEKPTQPKSNYAIPGLYIFSPDVIEKAKEITPSARGELEITDIIHQYLKLNQLSIEIIGRGIAWFDCGTPTSLQDASSFVSSLEKRQGLKFGCPEEVAVRMHFINKTQLEKLLSSYPNCSYREYLEKVTLTL